MKDHPIIFSGPMVRALLEGRKTMTRRLPHQWLYYMQGQESMKRCRFTAETYAQAIKGRDQFRVFSPSPPGVAWTWTSDPIFDCGGRPLWVAFPKIQPGDRLWVQETLRGDGQPVNKRPGIVRYGLDGQMVLYEQSDHIWEWKKPVLSGRFCPRWASRITLEVTALKIERLQDINREDCIAEGIYQPNLQRGSDLWTWAPDGQGRGTCPKSGFWALWTMLHGNGSWDANPDVLAISFKVHKQNIDAMKEAA